MIRRPLDWIGGNSIYARAEYSLINAIFGNSLAKLAERRAAVCQYVHEGKQLTCFSLSSMKT